MTVTPTQVMAIDERLTNGNARALLPRFRCQKHHGRARRALWRAVTCNVAHEGARNANGAARNANAPQGSRRGCPWGCRGIYEGMSWDLRGIYEGSTRGCRGIHVGMSWGSTRGSRGGIVGISWGMSRPRPLWYRLGLSPGVCV